MEAVHADLDPLAQDYEPVFWRYYLWAVKYFAQFHYLSQKAAFAAGRITTFDASPLAATLEMQWLKATMEKLEEYRLTKAGQDLEVAMGALKELLKAHRTPARPSLTRTDHCCDVAPRGRRDASHCQEVPHVAYVRYGRPPRATCAPTAFVRTD